MWLRTFLVGLLITSGAVVAGAGPAQADSTLCSGTSFSTCINAGYTAHGYENHYTDNVSGPGVGYWKAFNGHNCTNYAGYMLTLSGDAGPGVAMGNAKDWDTSAANLGYLVNTTPTVGSIAQWDDGDYGHVAYVEAVNGSTITVSEDNAAPYNTFRWRTINTSGNWPDHFLHIKDATTVSGSNNLQLSTVGTDGKVYTLGQTSPGTWSPNWAVINGNVKSTSVTTTPDGLQHIAALGGDGNIYITHQQANKQWGGWSQVQAQVTQVAIAATPEGKLHIAARGTDGKVYVLDEVNTGGPWSPNWTEINGNVASVAMVATSNGKLHIASKGGDANIYIVSQSASTGQWGSWSQVPAQVTQVAITVA